MGVTPQEYSIVTGRSIAIDVVCPEAVPGVRDAYAMAGPDRFHCEIGTIHKKHRACIKILDEEGLLAVVCDRFANAPPNEIVQRFGKERFATTTKRTGQELIQLFRGLLVNVHLCIPVEDHVALIRYAQWLNSLWKPEYKGECGHSAKC